VGKCNAATTDSAMWRVESVKGVEWENSPQPRMNLTDAPILPVTSQHWVCWVMCKHCDESFWCNACGCDGPYLAEATNLVTPKTRPQKSLFGGAHCQQHASRPETCRDFLLANPVLSSENLHESVHQENPQKIKSLCTCDKLEENPVGVNYHEPSGTHHH